MDENIIKYPKINTVWKRDENNKYRIADGDLSLQEFGLIKEWHITEKIDGTNIRVCWDGENITFGGRTDKTEIPKRLMEKLMQIFTPEKMKECFKDEPIRTFTDEEMIIRRKPIVLFGEGYGNKIQDYGSKYIKEGVDFILFDVYAGGLWVERENLEDIAKKLGIAIVPSLGMMTIENAISFVKSKPKSTISQEDLTIEGIVATSKPILMTRRGERLMWKIKVKDYVQLEGKK